MKPYKIDTLDLNIIEMLEEDCSLTYNEIAEKTGKTLWTVRDRMVLLRKRGIIRGCRVDIDYSKLGYGCRALIGFNVPADKIDAIVSFVKTQKRIKKQRYWRQYNGRAEISRRRGDKRILQNAFGCQTDVLQYAD